MTPYALLLRLSGLSQREAAAFHDVRPDTVKSWSGGRNRAPGGAMDELRELIARQELSAEADLAKLRKLTAEHGHPDILSLTFQNGDWPCESAAGMALARVIAKIRHPVEIE